MSGEAMHIRYQLCAFFRPACAADPLAIADSADRRLTLKRPKHKLLTLYHVKANPVNVLERDAQNRRRIRKNCCFVCFVLRIFFKLFLQKRVKSTFLRGIYAITNPSFLLSLLFFIIFISETTGICQEKFFYSSSFLKRGKSTSPHAAESRSRFHAALAGLVEGSCTAGMPSLLS